MEIDLLISEIFNLKEPHNIITALIAYFILFFLIGKISIACRNLIDNRNKKLEELQTTEKGIVLIILGLFAYAVGIAIINLFNGMTTVFIRTLIRFYGDMGFLNYLSFIKTSFVYPFSFMAPLYHVDMSFTTMVTIGLFISILYLVKFFENYRNKKTINIIEICFRDSARKVAYFMVMAFTFELSFRGLTIGTILTYIMIYFIFHRDTVVSMYRSILRKL